MTEESVENHIKALQEYMKSLDDSSRIILMHRIMECYCIHCGSELVGTIYKRCYCQVDD